MSTFFHVCLHHFASNTNPRDSSLRNLTDIATRSFQVPVLTRSVMPKVKKYFKQPTAKPGRKVPQKGRQFTLGFKKKVIAWKTIDNMKPKEIHKRVSAELGYAVSQSTLATWWSPKHRANLEEVGPDRTNDTDTRLSTKQRPAILVDMEHILARKVRAIILTGVPYTRQVIQILAIHIFHKLLSYHLYDVHGHRKNPGDRIPEQVLDAVEHSQIVSRYLCKSSKKTEHHKSVSASQNSQVGIYMCKLCPRVFRCEVNLTLHVYWHTIQTHGNDIADIENPNEISDDEGEQEDFEFKFSASPGWVYNFLNRHDYVNWE